MFKTQVRQEVIRAGAVNTSVSLDNVSRTVREAFDDRNCLIITNDSAQIIYLSLSGAASTSSAIRINSDGGSVTLGPNSSIPWTGAVYGIINTDSSATAVILEF